MAYRLWVTWGVVCVAGAMGFALYLEHVKGFEPCPMCIFQRVAMVSGGLVLLIAAIHGARAAGRWVYAGVSSLFFMAGAAIAGRHVWLQSLPEDQVPACGPALDYLMDIMPFAEVVSTVLRGDGNCAVIDWAWLGFSLPAWTLVGFVCLCAWSLAAPWCPEKLFGGEAR